MIQVSRDEIEMLVVALRDTVQYRQDTIQFDIEALLELAGYPPEVCAGSASWSPAAFDLVAQQVAEGTARYVVLLEGLTPLLGLRRDDH